MKPNKLNKEKTDKQKKHKEKSMSRWKQSGGGQATLTVYREDLLTMRVVALSLRLKDAVNNENEEWYNSSV